jgi:signal peptidase II
MKRKIFIIIFAVNLLAGFDQLIKMLIIGNVCISNSKLIIDNFFSLTCVKNYGAAFGIMSGNMIILIFITILLIYYIIREIEKNYDNDITLLSLTLILGGATGNLIDRIFRGYVVDYLSFKIFGYEVAIFNVADIFITFGVIFMIIILLKDGKVWKN